MIRRAVQAGAAALALAAVAGCASDPPRRATPIRAENLFLSPSGEPFRAGPSEPYASARWFAQADADHDGRLTRAEFQADALRAFRRFDADRDGVIDGIEIDAYEEKIAPEILPRIASLRSGEGQDGSLFGGRQGRGRPGEDGPQRGGRARAGDRAKQGAGLFGWLDEPEPLAAADADLDGRVTLDEWRKRTDRRFDLLADGADALTLPALPKTLMQTLWEKRNAEPGGKPPR